MARANIDALRARVAVLEGVLGEAYQLAGAVGAPVRVLDNLWAATTGAPLPHESFLPVRAEECTEVAELLKLLSGDTVTRGSHAVIVEKGLVVEKGRNLLAATLGRTGGQARSRAKAAASRSNGALGGRPRRRKRKTRTKEAR